MNKYEENISDIITLDVTEEIVDIFLEHAADTDDNVGLITNKELVEYAMDETLSLDWINVKKVDLELDDDIEYMISIDKYGDMVVQPVTYYSDKYFSAMEYVYISMDGDVSQMTIDSCINRDMNVVLFGYDDSSDEETEKEHEYTVNGKHVSVDEYNAFVSKFAPDKMIKTDDKSVSASKSVYKINGKFVDRETFEKELTRFEDRYMDNIQDMLLRYCDFMDEWNDLLKLLY